MAKTKFADAFEKLDLIIRSEEPEVVEEDVSGDKCDNLEKVEEKHRSHCQKLKEELDRYCRQLPCLIFNGSKYDLNLIKIYLAVQLNMHDSKHMFAVKRNNQYTCLRNENFKFLDIIQYLSPGVNYASFLKAFDVQESKGFFPYEWFTSVDKLDHT